MIERHGYSLVISTTGSEAEAEALARGLIHHRLAACVQLSPIVSHYRWQGEPTTSNEVLVVIKTTAAGVAQVMSYVEDNHSYDTPEIIEVPITSGSSAYLRWLGHAVLSRNNAEDGSA